ncbi:7400_t:CDS:2 [Entrophospora sp. SA101]|nr:7400_t:CDS:2 [Entrophospora sp. SA101]
MMITTPLAPSQSINESKKSHPNIKKNPTASISSDNLNHTSVTPKKRVASTNYDCDIKNDPRDEFQKIAALRRLSGETVLTPRRSSIMENVDLS